MELEPARLKDEEMGEHARQNKTLRVKTDELNAVTLPFSL